MTIHFSFIAANLAIAATVLAIIVAAAVAIRPLLSLPPSVASNQQPATSNTHHSPLSIQHSAFFTAPALALSAGGFALIIFLFAALGWIGRPLWWPFAALLHLAIAGGLALAQRRLSNCRLPLSTQDSALSTQHLALGTSHPWWRIAPALAFLAWAVASDLLKCFEPQFEADALWYHLTLPKYWVDAHSLRPHPTLTVAGYPLLIEMLYTVPVSHGLPFATRLIHLAFGVGIVLAIYGWLRFSPFFPLSTRHSALSTQESALSAAGALAFASAFFIFDPVNEVAAWAHTDLARAFFMVCAAACLATYADRGERRDLLVAAILSGFAMSTHYMAILFSNGLLTIAFIAARLRSQCGLPVLTQDSALRTQHSQPRSRASVQQIARDLAIFWLVSLAVFAPWLLKNLILYGQPLYGVANTSFRVPSSRILSEFFLSNVSYIGFALVALWLFARHSSEHGERLLAAYLVVYLLVGPFELPPIARFFLPVYAIGLMLAGRAAAPIVNARRWLEVALPIVLLIGAIATTSYQWQQHLYDAPLDFLLHHKPPAWDIIWHQ